MSMEQQSLNKQVFKIKFQPLILWLSVAVFALCTGGIALSVWRIFKFGIHGFTDVIKYPFLIAVCGFCIVLMICILIKSQYAIDGEYFITQYGFIKSKFAIKEITALTLDIQAQKLTIHFGEQFLVLAVCESWQEQLIRALLKINPDIDYSFTMAQAPEQKKDDDNKND